VLQPSPQTLLHPPAQDAAASYAAGVVGGLVYLRQLQRSVDGFGAFAAGAAGGQTRLLIPVALALGFNRCALPPPRPAARPRRRCYAIALVQA